VISLLNDPRLADTVGTVFGGAADSIRDFANASHAAEVLGERAAREDSYTDMLVGALRGGIAQSLEQAREELAAQGVNVSVEFSPVNLPVGEEHKYGADIGLRLTIKSPTATIAKGVLIQCKRMYGSPALGTADYPELRGRGEQQARDMLRVTPASFYLLYNCGSQSELIRMAMVPTGMLCPVKSFNGIPPAEAVELAAICPVWQQAAGTIWDLGVAALPASRVLAWSFAAKQRGLRMKTDAKTVLPGCLPLGVFIVDLFASCFVGDPRESVVRIVTPPAMRRPVEPEEGLESDEFDGFAVRYVMDVSITTEREPLNE